MEQKVEENDKIRKYSFNSQRSGMKNDCSFVESFDVLTLNEPELWTEIGMEKGMKKGSIFVTVIFFVLLEKKLEFYDLLNWK